jgi:hypothetical protein
MFVKYLPRAAVVVGGVTSLAAMAEDPATALLAVSSLGTSATGFGPVMFGLAVTVVGILIGVKWIKRARGAA